MENSQESLEEKRRRLLEELQLVDQQLTQKRQGSSTIREQSTTDQRVSEHGNRRQKKQENITSEISSYLEQSASAQEKVQLQSSSEFTYYEKRKGVVDLGKGYEYLTCALYALKFGLDDDVFDFSLTTNNKECGDFDDIEIQATFKNGKQSTFLFQLKHKYNKDYITKDMLTKATIQQNKKQQKSKFYLPNYLESITNFEENDRDFNFILYTNGQADIEDGSELSFKKYKTLSVEECGRNLEHKDLLLNCQDDKHRIFTMKPKMDVQTEELKNVGQACKKFYFFTHQDDIESIKQKIKFKLDDLLQGEYDIFDMFVQFMEYWWFENFVLTKHLLLVKLTELGLSPYIKILSGEKNNEKIDLLKETIMKFQMTMVNNSQEDTVVNMWSEVEENGRCIGSPLEPHSVRNKGELSSIQKTKILWHLEKVPLVIKVDKSNEKIIERVMTTLRKFVKNKKIVLLMGKSTYQFNEWRPFRSLSDLVENYQEEEYCSKIKNTFNISLQGREYISLDQLMNIDINIARYVTTEDLFAMSHREYILIGNQVDNLPDLHIPRMVYADFIETEEILEFCNWTKIGAVIVNCDETFKDLLAINFYVVELSEYLNAENPKLNNHCIFVSTKNKCTNDQFDKFCKMSKKEDVYLLQVVNKEYCMLVRGRREKNPFHFTRKYIEETDIFDYLKSPLNVFCAPPGMGKSRLLKILSYYCPPDHWSIHIDLINYNSRFAQGSNLQEIYRFFVELDDRQNNSLTNQIKNTLFEKKKVHVFLDGLDEVDSKHVELVMDFVQHLLTEDINVWVTSRENLRVRISRTLNVVPIEIKEVNSNEQQSYIYNRLKNDYQPEEIEKITAALSNSVDLNRSQALLGIPLQLYIITDMFINNKQVYVGLTKQNFFVLTKMYNVFFVGKIESACKKVIGDNQQHQLGVIRLLLKHYELVAVKACLNNVDVEKLAVDMEECREFIDELKNNGDKYGIIKNINEYGEAVFNHQTYAEYFASVWFKKNKDKMRVLGNDFFSERYENLRIMFDVMMAEDIPLHLAIIYKNINYFKEHIKSISTEDGGGRNALHIACCYGMKYPDCEAEKREVASYTEMITVLLQEQITDIHKCDDLFDFDYVDYSLASKCLYVIEIFLQKMLLTFGDLENLLFQYYGEFALLHYTAQMGYFNLFSKVMVITTDPNTDKREIHDLLRLAVLGTQNDVCTIATPREGNIKVVELLIKDDIYLNEINYMDGTLLDEACRDKKYDMLETLIESGAKCSGGNTVLHKLLEDDSEENEEFIIYLLNNWKVDVNAKNFDGCTAIFTACKNNRVKVLTSLLNKGAMASIPDFMRRNLLHNEEITLDEDIINICIRNGIDVNSKDILGMTPLLSACRCGNVETAKMLLDRGANIDDVNRDNDNALHISISMGDSDELVDLLVENGVDINAQNKKGISPLHVACKSCDHRVTNSLLQKGANINTVNIKNKNALHYASKHWRANREIIILLIANGIDVNCESDDGLTALQLARTNNDDEIVEKLFEFGATNTLCKNDDALNNEQTIQCRFTTKRHEKFCPMTNTDSDIYDSTAFHLEYKTVYFDLDQTVLIDFDQNEKTELHLSCYYGSTPEVEMLLQKGNILDDDGNTPLHYCCYADYCNDKVIQLLINGGVDVNAQNKYGQTSLHIACLRDNLDMVKELISWGAKCDIADHKKNNALHYTLEDIYETGVTKDDIEKIIIIILMNSDFDVNFQNEDGITPLHLACSVGHLDIILKFIHRGADATIIDNKTNNVLHYIMRSEVLDDEDVKWLLVFFLESNFVDINDQNTNGTTVLHLACLLSRYEIVKILFHEGAKTDILDNYSNNALHYASHSETSHEKLINYLLYRGLNINTINKNGTSPLHLACKSGNFETARILVGKGADMNGVDYNGNNILHYACHSCHSDEKLIKFLLDSDVNVNSENKNGTSPLHLACKSGNKKTVEALVANGASVNSVNYNNNNALHFASQSVDDNEQMIQFLSNYVAVDAINNDGTTALHFACKSGNDNNVYMLKKMKANPNSLDNSNNNMLHYASQSMTEDSDFLNNVIFDLELGINDQNNCGATPLLLACRSGNFKFVKLLHEHGAELNTLDNDKKNALHYALESPKQNDNLLGYLIENGIDINGEDVHGKTPLQLAHAKNDNEIVKRLLELRTVVKTDIKEETVTDSQEDG